MAFGAKIKLGVDTSNLSDLKKQIQGLIDEASKLSKLKIDNIKIEIDKDSINGAVDSLRKKLESQKFNVKIDKIDATAAMADLRKQITSVIGTSSAAKTGGLINADDLIDSKRIAAAASAAGSAFSSALKTSGNVFASREVIEAEDALRQYLDAATAAKGQQAQLLEDSLQYSAALKQENEQLAQAQKQASNAASVYTRLATIIREIKSVYTGSEKLTGANRDAYQKNAEALARQWLTLSNQVIQGISTGNITGALPTAQIDALSDSVARLKGDLADLKANDQAALDFSNTANGMTAASTRLETIKKTLASIVADSDKIRNAMSGDDFRNRVANFAKEWESLSNAARSGVLSDVDTARLDALVDGVRRLRGEVDTVQAAERSATFDSTNVDKLNNALQTLKQLRTETNDISNESQRNALLEQQKTLYDQIIAAQQNSRTLTDNVAVSDLASQTSLQQLEVYIARLKELRTTAQNTKVDSTDLTNLSNQQTLLDSIDTLLSQANMLKQQGVSIDATAVANLAAQTTQHASNVAQLQREAELYGQIATLRNKIATYLTNNPRVASSGSDQFYNILNRLSAGTINLSQANAEFNTLASTFHAAGLEGQTFTQQMSAGWRKFGGWSIVTRTFMTVISTIKKMVSSVKELDAAMTELKKVTSLTDTQYSQFFDTAAATAKSIGATVSDTINATADFARLGYEVDEAAELAEAALVYKNVGDGIEDVSDASESLISTLAAFGIEADNAMSIVDKFNEVGRFCPAA